MKEVSPISLREAFGCGWILGLVLALLESSMARGAILSTADVRGVALLILGLYPLVTGTGACCIAQIAWLRRPQRFVGVLLFVVLSPWLLSLIFPRVLNIIFLQPNRWPQVAGVLLLSLLLAREASRRPRVLRRIAPRRVGLFAVALVPLCMGMLTFVARSTPGPVPSNLESGGRHSNLLLITIDTLRKDELSCYGGPRENAPCIDSLAASGRVYSRATSCSPWTLASLANLMTGHYPSTTRVFTGRNRLAMQFDTLAELLRERAYHTHAIVSNIWLRPEFGLHQGFQIFDHRAPAEPNEELQRFFGYRIFRLTKHIGRASRSVPSESAEDLAQQACRFLNSSVPTPFFLWLHFNDVHDPYHPPEGFIPPREKTYRGPFRNTSGSMMTLRQGGRLSKADRRRIRLLYRGEIRYVDSQIRRVLTSLRVSGLASTTMVILTSDHGEEFWEHDNVMHGHTLYRELLEIPLVLAGTAPILPGERDNRDCSLVDVVPTILDALDLERPSELSGRSLMQPPESPDGPEYGEALQFYRELKSVVHDGWKLIQSPESGPVALFHLTADPGETVNEIDRFPDITQSLSDMLDAHLVACQERADKLSIRYDAASISLSPKLRAELRAQGYIE